jgi:glyoxylase-like metal-dependent hydrolase (beta-lactamase superfamily II)
LPADHELVIRLPSPANIWHVRERDRDLVADSGLGVASLRHHVPALFERDPVLVVTHAHLDHLAGAPTRSRPPR